MSRKCMGKNKNTWRISVYKCPDCGAEVEMGRDEYRVRCKKCNGFVYKDVTPSCIDWCPSARKCFGEEKWKAIRREK
jgi:DNA-directed RNA polymerase subunit RPC12/RpoP